MVGDCVVEKNRYFGNSTKKHLPFLTIYSYLQDELNIIVNV